MGGSHEWWLKSRPRTLATFVRGIGEELCNRGGNGVVGNFFLAITNLDFERERCGSRSGIARQRWNL